MVTLKDPIMEEEMKRVAKQSYNDGIEDAVNFVMDAGNGFKNSNRSHRADIMYNLARRLKRRKKK